MARTALATNGPDDDGISNYPALRGDPAMLLEVFQENLGGETITDRDLDAIKMPSGGGLSWDVPSIDGGIATKTLSGVVIAQFMRRAYWPTRDLSGAPPQCSSPNASDGYGDPGDKLDNIGACLQCPFAQFGSAPDRDDGTPSNGQACKQMRQVFLLMDDNILPRVLTLSPTSLAPSKTFFLQLAGAGHRYYAVTVNIGLEKKTAGNTPYSVATWALGAPLGEDEAKKVADYRDAILPMISRRQVTAADAQAAGVA